MNAPHKKSEMSGLELSTAGTSKSEKEGIRLTTIILDGKHLFGIWDSILFALGLIRRFWHEFELRVSDFQIIQADGLHKAQDFCLLQRPPEKKN